MWGIDERRREDEEEACVCHARRSLKQIKYDIIGNACYI